MSNHGLPRGQLQRPSQQAPQKVQVLTFEHFTGRNLHNQLVHMAPETRQALSFLGGLITGAINGVSRAVAPQGANDR
jgi:hypothetical protein